MNRHEHINADVRTMKVLVLGAGGMAGHVVSLYLREHGYAVSTLSGKNPLDDETCLLDVTDISRLESYLDKQTFPVIVNCIGLLVQQCNVRKDLAVFLNAYLPHYLENKYKDTATKIIHLSTDCVFSGQNAPYHERSFCDGELFYDKTKAIGELNNTKDLTFRMSIVGPDMQASGLGLFNWFMQQRGQIDGYTTAMWNGITTLELARAIDAAITQNLTGLYHLVPDQGLSKFDLLTLFKNVFNRLDIEIHESHVVQTNKTLVNTRQDFNFTVSDYPALVLGMKHWIDTHHALYPHYANLDTHCRPEGQ